MSMELQLGLALTSTPCEDININNNVNSKKRGFDHEVLLFDENRIIPKTLPLLVWCNQPNNDDDPEDLQDNGDGLVGWPPVKVTCRRKLHRQVPNVGADNNNNHMAVSEVAGNGCGSRALNSTYVKVKMEGVGIARKIDLSVHHSFETLTSTLMTMFNIFDENRKSFTLTYQDKEGDWLIAQDVPWRYFVGSIKCLKLIRSCRG